MSAKSRPAHRPRHMIRCSRSVKSRLSAALVSWMALRGQSRVDDHRRPLCSVILASGFVVGRRGEQVLDVADGELMGFGEPGAPAGEGVTKRPREPLDVVASATVAAKTDGVVVVVG